MLLVEGDGSLGDHEKVEVAVGSQAAGDSRTEQEDADDSIGSECPVDGRESGLDLLRSKAGSTGP